MYTRKHGFPLQSTLSLDIVLLLASFAVSHANNDNNISCFGDCECGGHSTDVRMNCASCGMHYVPVNISAFTTYLDLSDNNIQHISPHQFKDLKFLHVLLLAGNYINHLPTTCFQGILHYFHTLDLSRNLLQWISHDTLKYLQFLEILNLSYNLISNISSNTFSSMSKLQELHLKHNRIHTLPAHWLSDLPNLKTLSISANHIEHITAQAFNGSQNLTNLDFSRNGIRSIDVGAFNRLEKLQILDGHSNYIKQIPQLKYSSELVSINLNHNQIARIEDDSFASLLKLRDLILSHNRIYHIGKNAFVGLESLNYLDLGDNILTFIHSETLKPLVKLFDINVSDNDLESFPNIELPYVRVIKATNNPKMHVFPPPNAFPQVTSLRLTYAYHCCDYLSMSNAWPGEQYINENITFLASLTTGNESENGYYDLSNVLYEDEFLSETLELTNTFKFIECLPEPGPFVPCTDLMGWWATRCGVWMVFVLAAIGNATVLLVSVARRNISVSRFLVCNLAVADLLMGIYLGMIAVVDTITLGHFKQHAVEWQTSEWCQLAGFLAVFSSELSVTSLSVITLERLFAIIHDVTKSRKFGLTQTGYIMAFCWLFSLVIAVLPLIGISDYRKFAMCLPFETGDNISLGYVIFLLLFNMVAFFTIVCCYFRIYFRVRQSAVWGCRENRIACRMAIIVFTDLVCWAPICITGLAAALGAHWISLDTSKFLVVFILPLNSCMNPFIYALLTRQFRSDCKAVCMQLERPNRSKPMNNPISYDSNVEDDCPTGVRYNRSYLRTHSGNSNHSTRTMSTSVSLESKLSSVVSLFSIRRKDRKSTHEMSEKRYKSNHGTLFEAQTTESICKNLEGNKSMATSFLISGDDNGNDHQLDAVIPCDHALQEIYCSSDSKTDVNRVSNKQGIESNHSNSSTITGTSTLTE